MARCAAHATSTGERCKLDALAGSLLCEYHPKAEPIYAGRDAPEAPAAAPALGATSSEPLRDDFPAAPDPNPMPGGDPLEGLDRVEGGASAEPAAQRRDPGGRDVDLSLFRELLDDDPEPAKGEGPPPPPPPPGTPPKGAAPGPGRPRDVLEANPGPWTAASARFVLAVPLDAIYRGRGWRGLEDGEADAVALATAATMNRLLASADPFNPYAVLALTLVTLTVPRAAGDVTKAVATRARRRKEGDDPTRSSRPQRDTTSPRSSGGVPLRVVEPDDLVDELDREPAPAPFEGDLGGWGAADGLAS